MRLLQCPERESLPKLKENVTHKLIKVKDEISEKIKEDLEENESDLTDINSMVNTATTIITGKMYLSSKVG